MLIIDKMVTLLFLNYFIRLLQFLFPDKRCFYIYFVRSYLIKPAHLLHNAYINEIKASIGIFSMYFRVSLLPFPQASVSQ